MKLYQSVPFASWSEWEYVFRSFYPETEEASDQHLNNAINLVKVWELRFPFLPPAVSITSQLLAIKSGGFSQDTRLSLALLVIRSVNSVADSLQDKQYAQSIATLTTKAGLPRWLVDVRHDATHGLLPSLEVLISAVEPLLQFFKSFYWEKQANALKLKEELKTRVVDVLVNCAEKKYKSAEQLDAAVDSICESSGALFLSYLLDVLLPLLTAEVNTWERCLAGLHDGFPTFAVSLFNALCEQVMKKERSSRHDIYVYWIKYLISRRWHSLSDPDNAQYSPEVNLMELDQKKWKQVHHRWISQPASATCNSIYHSDQWIAQALLDRDCPGQHVLEPLVEATRSDRQAALRKVKALTGGINAEAGGGGGVSFRANLEELESFVASRKGKRKRVSEDVVPTCTLEDAAECNRWTLVTNYGTSCLGKLPKHAPHKSVLEMFDLIIEDSKKQDAPTVPPVAAAEPMEVQRVEQRVSDSSVPIVEAKPEVVVGLLM